VSQLKKRLKGLIFEAKTGAFRKLNGLGLIRR